MNQFKITGATLALLAACFAPSVRADDRTKETRIIVHEPLQVKDVLLAPGEYVFKLAEPDSNHTLVSIDRADGTRLGTIIGVSAYRADAGENLVTTFQLHGNQPVTLKSWYYRGDNFGVEFPVKKVASGTGRMVKSKGKRQPAAAADDASSTRD